MAYLIDSDWLIDHLANVLEATQLLAGLSKDGIAISSLTYMEAYQGVLRSPVREDAEERLSVLTKAVPVIPFSLAEARRCATLRESLQRAGKRVRSRAIDVLIAGTALEHNLTLVTRNRDDYRDIPGLKLYEGS